MTGSLYTNCVIGTVGNCKGRIQGFKQSSNFTYVNKVDLDAHLVYDKPHL